jgi:hypothetical protein
LIYLIIFQGCSKIKIVNREDSKIKIIHKIININKDPIFNNNNNFINNHKEMFQVNLRVTLINLLKEIRLKQTVFNKIITIKIILLSMLKIDKISINFIKMTIKFILSL